MVSAALSFLRQPLDPAGRLGMALVASVLLHALMLMALSPYSVHGNVFTRPVQAPLTVRVERLAESLEAIPLVINPRKASVRQKLNAPKPAATNARADIEQSSSQFGVSVSDTLYLRPISGRISSPLLESGEFRRTVDISERPQAVAMRAPTYPRPAWEQKLSGWVIVMLFVDEQGNVVDTVAVESSEAFNDYQTGIAAELRGATFTPGKLDGRVVKTVIFAKVRFDAKGLSGSEPAKAPTASGSIEIGEKR